MLYYIMVLPGCGRAVESREGKKGRRKLEPQRVRIFSAVGFRVAGLMGFSMLGLGTRNPTRRITVLMSSAVGV